MQSPETLSVMVEVHRGLYFRRGDGTEPLNAVLCCPLDGQTVVQGWFGKVCSRWQLEIFGGADSRQSHSLNGANICKIVLNMDWRGLVRHINRR